MRLACRAWCCVVGLALAPATVVGAGGGCGIDYETYPYCGGAASSIALLRAVVERASGSPTTAVRFLYDGDSQETSPGGQGSLYIPLMSYEFWEHFGNIPESQAMPPASYGPGSAALLQVGSVAGGVAMGDVSLARFPFAMAPGGFFGWTCSMAKLVSRCTSQ